MLNKILQELRTFFENNGTRHYAFRIQQLGNLERFLREQETAIEAALCDDLGKHSIEAFATEIAVTVTELQYTKRHLANWMKPKKTPVILALKPAKSYCIAEPLGVTLIISSWNYPLQLALVPMIGALAAGNCVVLKPSEFAPAVSKLLAEQLPKYISPDCLRVVEGNSDIAKALVLQPFNHIFYTGGSKAAKQILQAAAEHLTPVTLELGGKSPCIVDESANLEVAAKRIIWGKFSNAGQTCVAPDYLLVHEKIYSELIKKLRATIIQFYGENPKSNDNYGSIINQQHLQRLTRLLENPGNIIVGGEVDTNELYLAPTLVENPPKDSPLLNEEIFGPILPIIPITSMQEAVNYINQKPKPLTLYLFTNIKAHKQLFVQQTSSGSVGINVTMLQCAAPDLPFGGVGASGMGAYHGKYSFATFSHEKAVFEKPVWLDPSFQYPPYQNRLRSLLRLLLNAPRFIHTLSNW